jgi:hypothetical protein
MEFRRVFSHVIRGPPCAPASNKKKGTPIAAMSAEAGISWGGLIIRAP